MSSSPVPSARLQTMHPWFNHRTSAAEHKVIGSVKNEDLYRFVFKRCVHCQETLFTSERWVDKDPTQMIEQYHCEECKASALADAATDFGDNALAAYFRIARQSLLAFPPAAYLEDLR